MEPYPVGRPQTARFGFRLERFAMRINIGSNCICLPCIRISGPVVQQPAGSVLDPANAQQGGSSSRLRHAVQRAGRRIETLLRGRQAEGSPPAAEGIELAEPSAAPATHSMRSRSRASLLSKDQINALKGYLHNEVDRCQFLTGYKETDNYKELAAAIDGSNSLEDFKKAVTHLRQELTTGAGGYVNEVKVTPRYINALVSRCRNVLLEAIKASRLEGDGGRPRGHMSQADRRAARAVYEENRLFHGTRKDNVADIRRHGLDVSRKSRGATAGALETMVMTEAAVSDASQHNYLTLDKSTAKAFARLAGKSDQPGLARIIAGEEEFSLARDPHSLKEQRAFRTSETIPASRVLKSARSGDNTAAAAFREALARAGIDVSAERAAEMLYAVQSDSESDFDSDLVEIDPPQQTGVGKGKGKAAAMHPAIGGFGEPAESPHQARVALAGKSPDRIAQELLDSAKASEPAITEHLMHLAEDHGGQLTGLDERFKSIGSLRAKLEHRPAEAVNDALRFTIRFEAEILPKGTQGVLRSLLHANYAILLMQNRFNRSGPYVGINVILKSPAGQVFEVQFHTRDSLELRQRNHNLFERCKALPADSPEHKQLMDEMTENAMTVEIPEELEQELYALLDKDPKLNPDM